MARVALVMMPGLRSWRLARGLTQAELAARIGMRRATVWRIEVGHPTRPRTAHLLAQALGTSPDQLLRSTLELPPVDQTTLLPTLLG